jgi:hypothetical protein
MFLYSNNNIFLKIVLIYIYIYNQYFKVIRHETTIKNILFAINLDLKPISLSVEVFVIYSIHLSAEPAAEAIYFTNKFRFHE